MKPEIENLNRMTAKDYYQSTRMVDTRDWTLGMVMNFAEEYAEALRKHAVSSSVCHCNELPDGEFAISSKALLKPYGYLGQPVVSSRFTITYCEDGNLGTVQSYKCIAESKEMAEYDFRDRHNMMYTDILSVEQNGC